MASYALLERLKNLIDVDVDMSELGLAGQAFQEEVTKAISNQPDVKSYVTKLENQYDESVGEAEDMPTGTDMVHEIEEFLRSQSSGPEGS